MRGARVQLFVSLGGLFGFGKKKARPPGARPGAPPASPPPPAPEARSEAPKRSEPEVKFKGLHPDTNPSASVRPMSMTCESCGREFRYFVNASGIKTTANCPGCGRQYRV